MARKYNRHTSRVRPPAYRRRQLRRLYPAATALLAAFGDPEAQRALVTIDPGGSACRPAGCCS